MIVQARMGSTRLPGKVLADIGGRPAVAHVLERASQIAGIAHVVLAIPDTPTDDDLAAAGARAGVRVVRGDPDDVLNRYRAAAEAVDADAIVRITADCPLFDPAVSSRVVECYAQGGLDYVSNIHPPTYPDGYDTEAFSRPALDAAWLEAVDPFEREHVTPFIWRRPDRFRLANIADVADRASWRLTLDTAADLERLRAIWQRLGSRPGFGLADVVALITREPELLQGRS